MVLGDLSRRDFLKIGAAVAAAGAVAPKILLGQTPPPEAAGKQKETPAKPEPEYRVLGKTGVKVTVVAMGCMNIKDNGDLVRKALDLGINWFDTARVYYNGRNEGIVGAVLKGKRDKIYICTKSHGSKEKMTADLETSLKDLGTDHVDLWLAHGVGDRAGVMDEGLIRPLQEAKKAGKTRFIGFSVHSKIPEVLNAAVEAKLHDAIVVGYHYASGPAIKDAIAKASAAGIGIIAMKTMAAGQKLSEQMPPPKMTGGYSEAQAKLRWVLDDTNIACAIPGVTSFDQLDEDAAVMGKKLGYLNRRRLEWHAIQTASVACAGCGGCAGTCPRGVEIPGVRRCAMYLRAYKDEELARENYAQLAANAAPCADCASCTARCVRGAALQPLLSETHKLLA